MKIPHLYEKVETSGITIIDELNRVNEEMLNALFDVVFDDSAYKRNSHIFQKPLTKLEKALK